VLGNKVMVGTVNAIANISSWVCAIWPRLRLSILAGQPALTHPVKGLDNYRELLDKLTTAKGAIKVYAKCRF